MKLMQNKKEKIEDFTPPEGHEHLRAGFGVMLGFVVVLVGWAVWAELDSAAVAPGSIDVASENKLVNHLEGGIVDEIFVKEGDLVKKGQVLLSLSDTQQYSTAQLLSYRLDHLQANMDRIGAYHLSQKEPVFSKILQERAQSNPKLQELLNAQKERYFSDIENFKRQIELLKKRKVEIAQLIESLHGQVAAIDRQTELMAGEIEGLIILEKEQLVGKPQLLSLQRQEADLKRVRQDLVGRIAQSNEQISQIDLQIIQLKEDRESKRAEEFDQYYAQSLEVTEQLSAAKDRLSRMEIIAPVDGEVVGLEVHTVGGVVNRGEKLMELVPSSDLLLIEARVSPLDIDVVRPGLTSKVQLLPYSQRSTLQLEGVVTDVSPHVITDPKTGESYYQAKVEIGPEELEGREEIELYPGMPVQVMILTGKRSPLDYLIAPLRDSFQRSFLEQ